MIEMLGVLAIIAVISIGSYSFYRRAVDTHKANSIFDDVNRFEFVISEKIERSPAGEINAGDFHPASGFLMTAYNEPDKQRHFIMVSEVPESVCRILLEKGGEKYVMYAYNHLYEGNTSICDNEGEVVTFYFGETTGELCAAVPESEEDTENVCGDKCLCLPDDGRSCKADVKDNEQTKCCANDEVNCNNICRPACPVGLEYNDKCQCVCSDPLRAPDITGQCVCRTDAAGTQMVEDENGNCVCPAGKPNFYDEEHGGPLCCADKHIPYQGQCTKLECKDGTTGKTFKCHLNDRFCGISCNSDGTACGRGVCRAEECPMGTTMGFLPGTRMWSGGERYGCIPKDKPDCAYGAAGIGACWNPSGTHTCCTTKPGTDFECEYGTCTPSLCTALSTDTYTVTYSRANLVARVEGSCWFAFKDYDDLFVQCYPNGSTWICIQKEGNAINYCNGTCTNPPYCGGKCGTPSTCPTETELTDDEYCCKTIVDKTVCRDIASPKTYFKTDTGYEQCGGNYGYNCNMSTGYCSIGSCTESSAKCPTGWSYGKASSEYWGCVKGKYKCYRVGSVFYCNYDGQKCGENCTSQVGGCANVYRQECADVYTGTVQESLYYLNSSDEAVSVSVCPTGETCYPKFNCLYGSAVTAKCICDTNPTANVGQLCCAAGQSVVDNACVAN